MNAKTFSLDELCLLADCVKRTVRYYIQIGLVSRPVGEARAARYTGEHLNQLLRIKKLSEAGVSLERIREVLADIRAAKVKIGLASVSLNAPGILHALGIHQAFDFCADASRIRRSKPDPEIFLAACAGLNVRPDAAIGIEDAPAGVEAINAAGMLSVGVGAGLNHAGLQLHSTRELTWKCLTEFWASRTY